METQIPNKSGGSLNVVGTGIKLISHITLETQALIQHADQVFFLVNNVVLAEWIRELNPTAESLDSFYAAGKPRIQTYREMVQIILVSLRKGLHVCAIFYGHPGVYVTPVHEMILQARHEGFRAQIMPGISAEDCLFADLALDPAIDGCQSFDATEFLLRKRGPDITSNLILWQIGLTGSLYPTAEGSVGIQLLTDILIDKYGSNHNIVIYEASELSISQPRIDWIPLSQLPLAKLNNASTLYIPPKVSAALDSEMMLRLGINALDFFSR